MSLEMPFNSIVQALDSMKGLLMSVDNIKHIISYNYGRMICSREF